MYAYLAKKVIWILPKHNSPRVDNNFVFVFPIKVVKMMKVIENSAKWKLNASFIVLVPFTLKFVGMWR